MTAEVTEKLNGVRLKLDEHRRFAHDVALLLEAFRDYKMQTFCARWLELKKRAEELSQ